MERLLSPDFEGGLYVHPRCQSIDLTLVSFLFLSAFFFAYAEIFPYHFCHIRDFLPPASTGLLFFITAEHRFFPFF